MAQIEAAQSYKDIHIYTYPKKRGIPLSPPLPTHTSRGPRAQHPAPHPNISLPLPSRTAVPSAWAPGGPLTARDSRDSLLLLGTWPGPDG